MELLIVAAIGVIAWLWYEGSHATPTSAAAAPASGNAIPQPPAHDSFLTPYVMQELAAGQVAGWGTDGEPLDGSGIPLPIEPARPSQQAGI